MSNADLAATIDEAWEQREKVSPQTKGAWRDAVAAAVLDLVGQMFGDFSATAIRDGRSFLNDRIGKKLFGENITIHDDVWHPGQAGAPFDGEGLPRKRLTLVEGGVVREIAYSRQAAALAAGDNVEIVRPFQGG